MAEVSKGGARGVVTGLLSLGLVFSAVGVWRSSHRPPEPPFDPLAQARANATALDADIDARQVGGLGLVLVEQLAADARYAREQGRNRIWITLAIAAPPGTHGPVLPR